MELIFATANPGKVREVQEIADSLGARYGIKLDILPMPEKADIPETGVTYAENARQKASYVWDRYHKNCIADDSGLEVEALGGAPGIYTARYCDHNFKSGIEKMLHELDSLGAEGPQRRRGSFECCIALILDGRTYYFEGHCPGRISEEACGLGGFGFDPIFIPDADALGRCMAELPEAEKNLISHRGIAMENLFKWLKENNI